MYRSIMIAVALAAAVTGARAADAFLSVIEDLPVMQGLTEAEDSSVFFETANGRIAEASVSGRVAPPSVRDFYATVLPQLGWRSAAEGIFEREGERLRLAIETGPDGATIVRFSLSPAQP